MSLENSNNIISSAPLVSSPPLPPRSKAVSNYPSPPKRNVVGNPTNRPGGVPPLPPRRLINTETRELINKFNTQLLIKIKQHDNYKF
mgnify:CR=1 FL=1